MTTLFSDNFNRANSGTVDATNWTENGGAQWDIASNQVTCTGAGSFFLITTTSAHAAVADCKATFKLSTANASFDGGIMVRATSTGAQGYFLDIVPASNLVNVWRRVASADTQVGTDITGLTITNGDTFSLEVSGTGATVTLKVYQNGALIGTKTDSTGSRLTGAGQAGLCHFQPTGGIPYDDFLLEDLAAAAPVLSAATPSGTLGTTTTASLGATTDQNTGTLYGVVSTTNNVATATAPQIKAGQNSTGAAAAFSGNAAVSTTTPSVPISGLTAATGYFYAEVQNNTNGDSNVVSGTFTTATASVSRSQLLLLGIS